MGTGWGIPAVGGAGPGDSAAPGRTANLSGYRQALIIELGILVILLAITHHGPASAAAVGAWLGFAVHSILSHRRPATSLGGED